MVLKKIMKSFKKLYCLQNRESEVFFNKTPDVILNIYTPLHIPDLKCDLERDLEIKASS